MAKQKIQPYFPPLSLSLSLSLTTDLLEQEYMKLGAQFLCVLMLCYSQTQ